METELEQRCRGDPQHKQLRDVWNHAFFLVQVAYDLEWATSQFEMLEREAPNCLIKAVLLLNIGITYSLLAKYRHAEKAFQKVLPLHSFMAPLAHFFLGVVRFELTNYEQAQISFKLCACVLKQTDHNRSYRPFGLDFTLSHCLVVENEEIAAYEWTLKQKGRYGFRLLNRLPASLAFDATVLDDKIKVCCERTARPYTPGSAVSSSVFSAHSRSISSTTETTNNQTSRPVRDLTIQTSPMVPWRPFKKPMVPRAAQTEISNLRSLTHFLKYTGPEDAQTIRAEKATNTSPIVRQTNTSPMECHASTVTRDTGPKFQAVDQVKSGSLLRKVSTLTLNKTSSIRQMTKTVFSTPMERLGAIDVGKNRGAERGRVVPGPRHQPAIGTITHLSNTTAHRAVFGTTTEDGREGRDQQQANERISLDSHQIFSHGRLMM